MQDRQALSFSLRALTWFSTFPLHIAQWSGPHPFKTPVVWPSQSPERSHPTTLRRAVADQLLLA